MPTNFTPSFMQEIWATKNNLPSSAFKAQIEPETMLWKDVLPVESSDLAGKQNFTPYLRPIETSIGAQLTFQIAQGVPLPKVGGSDGKGSYKDEDIVKRAVRIAIERRTGNSR
jgi:hypothetical protein